MQVQERLRSEMSQPQLWRRGQIHLASGTGLGQTRPSWKRAPALPVPCGRLWLIFPVGDSD
jgi:hypothetical protein